MSRRHLPRGLPGFYVFMFFACLLLQGWSCASAQQVPDELLDEAARRSGLSREELLRRYSQGQAPGLPGAADSSLAAEPGRTDLAGIDDRRPVMPYEPRLSLEGDRQAALAAAAAPSESTTAATDSLRLFGRDFFRLEPGVFAPSSFGPVPEDYLIGVGDQIVVDVWGEVEFRLERVVDRDGSIILPKGGKIFCLNRTLAQVAQAVRERLARSYSGISREPGKGTTFLDVTLGRLRAIRVFVVGDAVQPGAYELSSVATVFTALYAAGGPSPAGSMRDVHLMRGEETVARLDLYAYLLEGRRTGDAILREGDTVFVPRRGASVRLMGQVRRPAIFELLPDEGLADLLRFGGGFTARAATEIVHVERILPPAERAPDAPDRIVQDVVLDPLTGQPRDPAAAALRDGDAVQVGAIADRLENWVEIAGNVKRPGRFEYREGMDVTVLIALAAGLWPDTLEERALIDRIAPDGTYEAVNFDLGAALAGRAPPVLLQPRDRVRIFSKWNVQDRYEVSISGEVRAPGSFPYREGLTLRDVILKSGGLKESADLLRAEVSRLRRDAVTSRDTESPPERMVDVIELPLGENYLAVAASFPLEAHDRVAIRRLPWWELPRTVTVRGEVYYPGAYSLERPDERLSEVIERAGGLKPTAFAPGARIYRSQEDVGNIAIELGKALTDPQSQYDVILRAGDEVLVPEAQHTVRVTGAVGFPTSLLFKKGMSLGEYVDRAGGYAEGAAKWKTRVVYPNGLSRPIKRIWRDPSVMPGSTIIVPIETPREDNSLETVREIAAIMASLATVYLVIDRTTN